MALLFLDHGTRRGWGFSFTTRPHFTPGKDPVHIAQEAGWAPGPVWTSAENLASTWIRSPNRPARSQSLYRLRYPTHIPDSSTALYNGILNTIIVINLEAFAATEFNEIFIGQTAVSRCSGFSDVSGTNSVPIFRDGDWVSARNVGES